VVLHASFLKVILDVYVDYLNMDLDWSFKLQVVRDDKNCKALPNQIMGVSLEL
jgi:hypothetical protein